ncbi:MAG: hypothetical protein LKG27_05065 [Clostridiaceae bacterium]|jgi:hypothetical protein|nr:hypothetical protein [Clostridiaceae bacterium]
MKISRIDNNNCRKPAFNAKFVKNEDIMKFTQKQVGYGNGDLLSKALEELANIKKNVCLEFKNCYGTNTVRNLYNGKNVQWEESFDDSKKLLDLSNPDTKLYRDLFTAEVNEKNIIRDSKAISNKFFVSKDSVPKYGSFNIEG